MSRTDRKSRPGRAPSPTQTIRGTVKVDRTANAVADRLRPGEIAVVDHRDMDRATALALLAARPAAVLNSARTISGRYPTLGARLLVDSGVPLIDDLGPDIMALRDGEQVVITGGDVSAVAESSGMSSLIAEGDRVSAEAVEAAQDAGRAGVLGQVQLVAGETVEQLSRQRDQLVDGAGLPTLDGLDGRDVLIVARGYRDRAELASVRLFVRERRPIIVAVDGGADLLRHIRKTADVLVGDLTGVTDDSVRKATQLITPEHGDGRSPGHQRAKSLGRDSVVVPTGLDSETLAILLALHSSARMVVVVGGAGNLDESLDKGPEGMAGAVAVRMLAGDTVVPASAVAHLYRSRISGWQLTALGLAALLALGLALWSTGLWDISLGQLWGASL